MKWLLFLLLATIESAWAVSICRVCLTTPQEISQLTSHNGTRSGSQPRSRKLVRPLFTGDLFYSVDDEEPKPLPKGQGVYFELNDRMPHQMRILRADRQKVWHRFSFDCGAHDQGLDIRFAAQAAYSPGWMVYPLTTDPRKCSWHPQSRAKE